MNLNLDNILVVFTDMHNRQRTVSVVTNNDLMCYAMIRLLFVRFCSKTAAYPI